MLPQTDGSSDLSISKNLKDVLNLCGEREIRFATAWFITGDRDEAARRLNINVADTYRDPFNLNVVRLKNALASDPKLGARTLLEYSSVKAARVLDRMLDSPNEKMRLEAARTIIKSAIPEERAEQNAQTIIYKVGIELQMLDPSYEDDLNDGDIVEGTIVEDG